jgi:hypothetical protein
MVEVWVRTITIVLVGLFMALIPIGFKVWELLTAKKDQEENNKYYDKRR